ARAAPSRRRSTRRIGSSTWSRSAPPRTPTIRPATSCTSCTWRRTAPSRRRPLAHGPAGAPRRPAAGHRGPLDDLHDPEGPPWCARGAGSPKGGGGTPDGTRLLAGLLARAADVARRGRDQRGGRQGRRLRAEGAGDLGGRRDRRLRGPELGVREGRLGHALVV